MSKLRFFGIVIFVASFALAAQIVDNAAVIKMTRGHVPEPIILKMVNTQQTQFDFSAEKMIELTDAGVSENVISAMVNRAGTSDSSASHPATPTPTPVVVVPWPPAPVPVLSTTQKIPVGLDVKLKVLSELKSESAQEGDSVQLEVVEDVRVGDQVVIPQGSKALGQVAQVSPKGRFGASGTITLLAKSVDMPDGTQVRLQGMKGIAGGVSGKSALYGPYAPFARGKGAKISEGTILLATTLN